LRASGKKVIQYHGWADAAIPAQYSIAYYEAVEKYLGRSNADFYRLFMVPGMAHCAGGPGPNVFNAGEAMGAPRDAQHDVTVALEQWVEKGIAPQSIIATKFREDDPEKGMQRTGLLCPWPQVARWSGHGSTDQASNYRCEITK
jgi:feruloyl esterase